MWISNEGIEFRLYKFREDFFTKIAKIKAREDK